MRSSGLGGPKRGTVSTFEALEAQSEVLSALFGPRGPNVWYCRHFSGPGGPKRGTVSTFRALGAQSVVPLALFAPLPHRGLVGAPIGARSGP